VESTKAAATVPTPAPLPNIDWDALSREHDLTIAAAHKGG